MDTVPSILSENAPAWLDMTKWMAVPRNLITYKLLQLHNRTPTAREVDVAELQEAWNRAHPYLISLVVDGVDSEHTEKALREWLERLRAIYNPWRNPWIPIPYIPIGMPQITLPAHITPVDFHTPAGTTAPAGITITDSTSGIQYEIRSKL